MIKDFLEVSLCGSGCFGVLSIILVFFEVEGVTLASEGCLGTTVIFIGGFY